MEHKRQECTERPQNECRATPAQQLDSAINRLEGEIDRWADDEKTGDKEFDFAPLGDKARGKVKARAQNGEVVRVSL